MFLSTLHTSIIFKATRHRSSNCRYSGHRWNLTEVPLVTDNWHIAVPSGCATFALILIMYLQRMLQAVRMSSRSFESHDRSTNPRTVLFWILLALIFCVVFPISYIALHFYIFHFHNFNFVGATAAPLSLYSMHINTTHAQLLAVWHLSKWPQHHTRPFVTLALSPNKHVSLCLCVYFLDGSRRHAVNMRKMSTVWLPSTARFGLHQAPQTCGFWLLRKAKKNWGLIKITFLLRFW